MTLDLKHLRALAEAATQTVAMARESFTIDCEPPFTVKP